MILRRLWHALLTASVTFALSTQSRVTEQLGDDLYPIEDHGAGILLTPNRESSIASRVDRSRKIITPASNDTHDLSKLPSTYQATRQSAVRIKRVPSGQRPMTDILRQAVVFGRTYALWLMRKEEIGQVLLFDTSDLEANGWTNKVIYQDSVDVQFPSDLQRAFKQLALPRTLTKIPLCTADQDKTGKTFVRTDAEYHNYISFDKGVIITQINVSPEKAQDWAALPKEFYKPPPIRKFSDITTLQWIHFMEERQKKGNRIRWWFFHDVVDATTKQIMADILAGEQKQAVGPGRWPGLAYTWDWDGDLDDSYGSDETDDYAMALLGSPEGRGLAETIAAHAHVFEQACLPTRVHFFVSRTRENSGAVRLFTNLAFSIGKIRTGDKTPTLGSGSGNDAGEGSSKGAGEGSSKGKGSASGDTSEDDSSDVSGDESGDVSDDEPNAE